VQRAAEVHTDDAHVARDGVADELWPGVGELPEG